jgi:hypothetical protein
MNDIRDVMIRSLMRVGITLRMGENIEPRHRKSRTSMINHVWIAQACKYFTSNWVGHGPVVSKQVYM